MTEARIHSGLKTMPPAALAPSGGAVQAGFLDAREGLTAIGAEWRALSLEMEQPSCFASPSYFRTWTETLADDVDPLLLVARRNGRLLGVMPMMRATVRRGPMCVPRHDFAPSDRAYLAPGKPRPFRLRQLSQAVSMPACWTAPVTLCRAEDRDAVVAAMAAQIAALPGWDVLALAVDEGGEQEAWHEALRGAGLSPAVLELGRRIGSISRLESLDAILAKQGWKFRQNVRRARKAATEAGLCLSVHSGHDDVSRHLEDLAALARQSWKQTGRAGTEMTVPYSGRQQRFFETLLNDPGSRADLVPVLALARCEGRPVAGILSLRHGQGLTAMVIFRTDEIPAASPGLLVMGHMIDWAAQQGLPSFDLNATHEWTRYLIDHTRAQNVLYCFAPTLRGRVFSQLSALTRRLK